LKTLAAISSKITTIKNVIYFEDGETTNDLGLSASTSYWKVSSFSEVEELGKNIHVPPSLPTKNGIAVVMYTSGSTGQPKVCPVL
jgi:long-chain acyl-CoA synthetase